METSRSLNTSIREKYYADTKHAESPTSVFTLGASSGYLSSTALLRYSWTGLRVGSITYVTALMQATRLIAITLTLSAFSLTALALIEGLVILATPFWWLLLLPTFGPLTSGLLSLYFTRKR